MQKYKACFIVGAICLIVGGAIGIGATYYTINANADARIAVAESKFTIDRNELIRQLDDARDSLTRAQDASAKASRELADYRKLVEIRDRERQAELERIIGQANAGGSGAVEIASGLDGDLDLIRRIQKDSQKLVEGLRGLQKGQ